ncbi:MAG: HXXEE domain-containing protein [Pseudomonadota bacterium]
MLARAALALLLVMLWLPIGQHAFLVPHWMKVGTFIAPVLLYFCFAEGEGRAAYSGLRTLAVLMLVLYIVHQFEEHWLDVFGNEYAFYGAVNELLASALGQDAAGFEVLTPASIFVINTSLVWLVGLLAIESAGTRRFPVLAMNGIILVNAITHIVAAIIQQAYNPGLLSAALLFVPFALWFYHRALVVDGVPAQQAVASVIWALLAHVLMVGGLLGANWLRWYPEFLYFVALVLWSLVPLALFRGSTGQVEK